MKISKLIKELKSNYKKYGDIDVAFYEGSVNQEVDNEYSVHDVDILGAFKVPQYDSNRNKKTLVLKSENSCDFSFGNQPLVEVRKRK